MRILYVISGLGMGGAEKQLVGLARQMATRGHDVAIYTLNSEVPRKAALEGSPVAVLVDQKRSRLDFAVLGRLRRTIGRWQPDLIHGFLFDGDLYSRLAALGTGIPVLNSERNDDYRLSAPQWLAHRLTRALARGVVANTHSGRVFARRRYALPPDRAHVVWNGICLDELEQQARAPTVDVRTEFFGNPRVRVACLVGSIKPGKDYHLALESAAALIAADPAWRVLFIGDRLSAPGSRARGRSSDTSGYKADILEHYRRVGLPQQIRFAGLRNDVPALVRQCDVLFVTSRHEGFPNAVLEAMGLGVPVVSTEYSDIRRILPLPDQVVARRAPPEMARAILWAQSERASIAARQKDWVLANATLEKSALALEQVYRQHLKLSPVPLPA